MIEQIPDELDFVDTYFQRQARRKLAWFLSKAKVWLYLGFAFGVLFGGIGWLMFR